MAMLDPILFRQVAWVERILADEAWLEGERRGCAVGRHDPVVRARACEIVLRLAAQVRAELEAGVFVRVPHMIPPGEDGHGRAA